MTAGSVCRHLKIVGSVATVACGSASWNTTGESHLPSTCQLCRNSWSYSETLALVMCQNLPMNMIISTRKVEMAWRDVCQKPERLETPGPRLNIQGILNQGGEA